MASKFTPEEREAMKARAAEAKAAKGRAAGLKAIRETIDKMTGNDREISERLHDIIMTAAPELEPRTWYGQPAYEKNGKVVVFFQAASKFKTRYLTLGFQEHAALDDGTMWATSYAVTAIDDENARRIAELVRTAVS